MESSWQDCPAQKLVKLENNSWESCLSTWPFSTEGVARGYIPLSYFWVWSESCSISNAGIELKVTAVSLR